MKTDKSLLLLLSDDNEDDIRHLNLRTASRSNKRSSNYNVPRLRSHFYTLIGFVFGFLMAYITLLYYDRQFLLGESLEPLPSTTNNFEYYQTGEMLNTQAAATSSNRNSYERASIAKQLDEEVRILCMILTCPKYHIKRAKHVLATWGQRCTKVIFMSSEDEAELGAIKIVDNDEYVELWNKTREGFRYVYERYYDEYDWFLKADDDTYIVMENLRYMLYSYPSAVPIYFGYEMTRYDVSYMSGGASYVLSKSALHNFMTSTFNNNTLCPQGDRNGAEDFYMGICLQNAGVIVADSRLASANDNKNKFFPLDMIAYMNPNASAAIPDWVYEMTPYAIDSGLKCCSNYSVAFHYTDPQHMYLYEYFIYYLRLFGFDYQQQQQHYQQLPKKLTFEETKEMYADRNRNSTIDLNSDELPDNF